MPNIFRSLLLEEDAEIVEKTAKALASSLRLKMFRQLHEKPMTIAEIAKLNKITNSTAIFHLNLLLDAKIVRVQYLPSKKGSAQVFFINSVDQISFFRESQKVFEQTEIYEQKVSVGMYVDTQHSTIGMATTDKEFGYVPVFDEKRKNAILIWSFGGGVTYAFSNVFLKNQLNLLKLEFSFEICSETTSYRNDWKSDIFIAVNNVEVCHYLSPGDFGGVKGKFNPDWWPQNMTQYGNLISVSITNEGTFLNNTLVSEICLSDLNLKDGNKILLSIYNKKDSTYYGGFNLFGKGSGNYDQDINLTAYLQKEKQ